MRARGLSIRECEAGRDRPRQKRAMMENQHSRNPALAARIVAALMDAGLLDARFEDEAIRVVAGEIGASEQDSSKKDGPHGRSS